MEIKTSKEIMHDCQDCTVDQTEKWIAVDDLIEELDKLGKALDKIYKQLVENKNNE